VLGDDILIERNTFGGATCSNDAIRSWGTRWTIRLNTFKDCHYTGENHIDFWQSWCMPEDATGRTATYHVIENNTFARVTGNGGVHFALANHTNGCVGPLEKMIWRYNTISNIGSAAFGRGDGIYIDRNRGLVGTQNAIYNNTFDRLAQGAHAPWHDYCCNMNGSTNSRGVNNLFYDAMDPAAAQGFTWWTGGTQRNNLYYEPGSRMTFGGPASRETGAVKNRNPLLTDPDKDDYSLQAGSPARDAGGPLTSVASTDAGTGTSLVVDHAFMFSPGWGDGVQADCIAIGTVSTTRCIVSIDYAKSTITLDSAVDRNNRDPVWLYSDSGGSVVLAGAAPDIGAHEFNEGALSVPRR
jgi:hypothetical protein